MQLIFWLLLIIIFYVYIGYPLSLLFVGRMRRIRVDIDTKYIPEISLIIAAYNEEQVIEAKIRNSLELDYPKDKLQIIVASDASTDRTNEIVKNYSDKGIGLYAQKEHKGKSTALNYIVENMAKGQVIVFNDATTLLERDSIKRIISYFKEDKIGAVAGKLIFKGLKKSSITHNHGLYWKYEEFLRESESKVGYLPFVSGAFYAIRRGLYTKVKEGFPDDSVSPLNVLKNGKKVVFANDAVGYEVLSGKVIGEFKIRVRGVIRELASILDSKELLNPFKYPLVCFILFSHRVLRWCVPFFLLCTYICTIVLINHKFFGIAFWCQNIFYLLALLGIILERKRIFVRLFDIPFYFCLVNISAAVGVIKFIFGARQATWTPVRSKA